MRRKHEIFYISGSMFGNKSRKVIDLIKLSEKEGVQFLVFKPVVDTRDGLFIKSRNYDESYPALGWDGNSPSRFDDFKNHIKCLKGFFKLKVVFFDEVNFLSLEDMKFIVNICRVKGITLIMSGLETTFKQEPFLSTEWLKTKATRYIFSHGNCNYCEGENAVYNILFDKEGNVVREGQTIQPGSEDYRVSCKECYEKEIAK